VSNYVHKTFGVLWKVSLCLRRK